jgi:hypothetical protein
LIRCSDPDGGAIIAISVAFPDMILDADYEPEPVESDGDEEPDDDLS